MRDGRWLGHPVVERRDVVGKLGGKASVMVAVERVLLGPQVVAFLVALLSVRPDYLTA